MELFKMAKEAIAMRSKLSEMDKKLKAKIIAQTVKFRNKRTKIVIIAAVKLTNSPTTKPAITSETKRV